MNHSPSTPPPPKPNSESLLDIEIDNLHSNSATRFTLSALNASDSLTENETDFEKIIEPEPQFSFSYFFEFLGKIT